MRVWCAAAAAGQEPYSLAMEHAERKRQLAVSTVEIRGNGFRAGGAREGTQGPLQPV
ncbi:MAG: CheR family methyltransferase [Methyloceanibacter sp.]